MRWLQNLLLLWLFAVVFSKRSKQNQQVSSREDGAPPELKQELLNLMGLPRRPTLSYVTRVYGKRFSAPRYMIKLYNSLSQNQTVESPGFCCNGTVVDSRAVGADTIMSYLNHEKGRRPKISHKHATFKFNVLTPIGEKVTATEFRLYKEPRPGDMLHWRNSTYKLRLYQVIYPAQVLYLLEQKIIRSWETGWQDFDITAAGKAWSETPEKNYGLELAVLNFNNEEISPHKAGFVGFHGPQEKRPFLVNFFRQDGDLQFSRRIYPSEMRGHRSARVSRDLSSQMGGGSNGISSNKLCQRRVLHVSFRKLSWEDWVIAPEGYSAYYCDGECSFPLNANMNATNHAIVQTLVHLMNPRTVPKPCCAPTKLTAISVLYFDDSNNVVLKKYNNMVVTACGCH